LWSNKQDENKYSIALKSTMEANMQEEWLPQGGHLKATYSERPPYTAFLDLPLRERRQRIEANKHKHPIQTNTFEEGSTDKELGASISSPVLVWSSSSDPFTSETSSSNANTLSASDEELSEVGGLERFIIAENNTESEIVSLEPQPAQSDWQRVFLHPLSSVAAVLASNVPNDNPVHQLPTTPIRRVILSRDPFSRIDPKAQKLDFDPPSNSEEKELGERENKVTSSTGLMRSAAVSLSEALLGKQEGLRALQYIDGGENKGISDGWVVGSAALFWSDCDSEDDTVWNCGDIKDTSKELCMASDGRDANFAFADNTTGYENDMNNDQNSARNRPKSHLASQTNNSKRNKKLSALQKVGLQSKRGNFERNFRQLSPTLCTAYFHGTLDWMKGWSRLKFYRVLLDSNWKSSEDVLKGRRYFRKVNPQPRTPDCTLAWTLDEDILGVSWLIYSVDRNDWKMVGDNSFDLSLSFVWKRSNAYFLGITMDGITCLF